MRRSAIEFEIDRDLESAREEFLDELGSPIARNGFGPKDFAETYLIFERRYIPGWAIALAVLLFPIGLLFLIGKNTATLFVQFDEESGRTDIKVDGKASGRVWRLIRNWETAQA